MKSPTCSINAKDCPLKHLALDTCDSEKAICLPCDEMNDIELEDLKGRIEDYRSENGIDY